MAFNPENYTLDEMIDQVIEHDEIMIVRRKGQPAAVVMKYESWMEMNDDLDQLTQDLDGNRRKGVAP